MYHNFEIHTAEDLVKGFAILLRDGQTDLSKVYDFIMECTDNDERLSKVTVEKVLIHLESMNYFSCVS